MIKLRPEEAVVVCLIAVALLGLTLSIVGFIAASNQADQCAAAGGVLVEGAAGGRVCIKLDAIQPIG